MRSRKQCTVCYRHAYLEPANQFLHSSGSCREGSTCMSTNMSSTVKSSWQEPHEQGC